MNVGDNEFIKAEGLRVLSFLEQNQAEIPLPSVEEILLTDTLKIESGEPRKLVSINQFPDQSMYVLDEQLQGLKENIKRIKFYLDDLGDLLPR